MISKISSTPTVIQSLKGHLTIWALLMLLSCTTAGGPTPKWDGSIWPGDHTRGGVTRKEESPKPGEPPVEYFMSATSPEFDHGFWMSYHDFESFYSTYVLGCKQWKKGVPMMSAKEALNRFQPVVEDMQREAAEASQTK